jgi:hypothetical protein
MPDTIVIQETLVTPGNDALTVQLYISDKPRDSESAAIRIALTAIIPSTGTMLMAEVQNGALLKMRWAIEPLLHGLESEIRKSRQPL